MNTLSKSNWQFITLCISLGICIDLYSDDGTEASRQKPTFQLPQCKVPGLVGTYPYNMCAFIEALKEYKENKDFRCHPSVKNKTVVLDGHQNVDKYSIAQVMAKNTNSSFLWISGGEIRNTSYIESEIKKAKSLNKNIILYIDDFESNSEYSHRNLIQSSICKYWDMAQKEQGIFVVLAPEHSTSRMYDRLYSRAASSVAYIKNYDSAERKELLQQYSNNWLGKQLEEYCDEDIIKELVENTERFNTSDIEEIISLAHTYVTVNEESLTSDHVMFALYEVKKAVERRIKSEPNHE